VLKFHLLGTLRFGIRIALIACEEHIVALLVALTGLGKKNFSDWPVA
jgi:hypothetical protein